MKRTLRPLSLAVSLALGPGLGEASALEGLQPGMKAPAIELDTLGGGRVRLPVAPAPRATLVVFWATWGQSSAEVLGRAQKLRTQLGERELSVIGLNVESQTFSGGEVDRVKAATTKLGLTFPIALDRGLTAFHAYGIVAVPSSILVNADGDVVAQLAAYPIATREDFFELAEATALGRAIQRRIDRPGPAPNPRAVRYFNLARGMLARGLADQAEANLTKAVESDPAFVLPRVLLGQVYRERAVGHTEIRIAGAEVKTVLRPAEERERFLREAEAQLAEAARLDPTNPAVLTELAQVYLARGDTTRAREIFGRVAAANPDYPPARSQLGALLVKAGDVERGRAEMNAAIMLNALDWRLHVTAGEAYAARGLLREAVSELRRGTELLWQARGQDDRPSEGK